MMFRIVYFYKYIEHKKEIEDLGSKERIFAVYRDGFQKTEKYTF